MKKITTLIFFLIALPVVLQADISYHFKKMPYSRFLEKNKLTVVATFDGSKDLNRWQEILDFAKRNKVKFTFFVSGVYFITDAEKNRYVYPPDPSKRGLSEIGFGGASTEVARRIEIVNEALKDGHDIESHLNGHFDSSRWTTKAWELEFKQFYEFTKVINSHIRHVRFPLLVFNRKVYNVLPEFGIKSIVSVLDNDYEEFSVFSEKYKGSPYVFLEFPISYEHMKKAQILLMDYNFYYHDKKNHLKPHAAQDEMLAYYLKEAESCFKEQRPFFISHHFSDWNHDAYWEALQKIIPILKLKYNVDFLTVSDLYKRISIYPSVMEGSALDRMSVFFDNVLKKKSSE